MIRVIMQKKSNRRFLNAGKPVAILLTHGHFDHILAAEAIRDRYQIPIYACQKKKDASGSKN